MERDRKRKRRKGDQACRDCGRDFPLTMVIDGKARNLTNRQSCLDCLPFGKRRETHKTVECVACGKETTNPKFCSRSCAAKVNNSISPKREKTRREKPCAYCGALTDNPKYCSNTCSTAANRRELSELVAPSAIRRYLLRTREHRCQMCQNTEWLGEPIALEVDHIDGDSDNNTEENLRLICPNCHATTPQWKNRGGSQHTSKRKYRRDRYAAGKTW